jgi:hypothetical protein
MRNREAEVQEEARKRESEQPTAELSNEPGPEPPAVAQKTPYAGPPNTKHSNRCLITAKDDEPIFVLKASDLLAVSAVAYWIDMARATGVNAEKIEAACRHLDQMVNWASRNATKVPD